jgi:thioredoxin-related protein
MKRIFSLLIFCISLTVFSQESINFETLSFKDLLAKAKSEKKLIFMDAFAAWCGPCKMMDRNIFPLKSVRDFYNTNYINARFDMEKGEGREIAVKYGIRAYPSYLFLNGDGEVVLKNQGYMDEQAFLAFGQEANNPKLTQGSYKEIFEKGEQDPEFLINMMRLYTDTDYELAKKVSERYFKVKKNQALTKDDLSLLLYFLKSPQDINYTIFSEKKAEIEKIMSPEIYHQFDSNIKVAEFLDQAVDQKTGTVNDDYFYKKTIPIVGKSDAEIALNRMKVGYFSNIGNWAGYEKAALIYYKNAPDFNSEELLTAAWLFSEHVTDPGSLKKGTEWAEKSVMQSENVENTLILANLYAKIGQRDNAKTFATLSSNLAQSQGKDTTAAKKLLETLK